MLNLLADTIFNATQIKRRNSTQKHKTREFWTIEQQNTAEKQKIAREQIKRFKYWI